MPRTKTDRQKIRDDHPDSWIAVEEGDSLYGPVLDVTEAWSDQRNNGSWYPLLTVRVEGETPGYDDGAEVKVHCFGAVLYNEVMKHQPEVGERIRITYRGTGEAKQKGLNPPELYTLRVEGRADQAQRAYARIRGDQPTQPASEPDVPIEPVQPELGSDGGDDLPF